MTKSKGAAAGAKRGAAEQRAAGERIACNHNCPLSLCEDQKVNESNHGAEQHKASRYQHESVTAGPVLSSLVALCSRTRPGRREVRTSHEAKTRRRESGDLAMGEGFAAAR